MPELEYMYMYVYKYLTALEVPVVLKYFVHYLLGYLHVLFLDYKVQSARWSITILFSDVIAPLCNRKGHEI